MDSVDSAWQSVLDDRRLELMMQHKAVPQRPGGFDFTNMTYRNRKYGPTDLCSSCGNIQPKVRGLCKSCYSRRYRDGVI